LLNALAAQSVNSSRMTAIGMGESNPIADNSTVGRTHAEPSRQYSDSTLSARAAGHALALSRSLYAAGEHHFERPNTM